MYEEDIKRDAGSLSWNGKEEQHLTLYEDERHDNGSNVGTA